LLLSPVRIILAISSIKRSNLPQQLPNVCLLRLDSLSMMSDNEKRLVVMILRVYALYGRPIPLLSFLLLALIGQVIISSIGIVSGFGTSITHSAGYPFYSLVCFTKSCALPSSTSRLVPITNYKTLGLTFDNGRLRFDRNACPIPLVFLIPFPSSPSKPTSLQPLFGLLHSF